jgi:Flp pilus assembly protein TadG
MHGPARVRGIAAVEFVVTAPFLLLLLVAGAEIGRAFVQYQTLSYSVRQSARYASENSINGTTGVVNLSILTITRAQNLAVYGNILGTGTAKLPGYQTGQVQVVNAGGDNIQVTATYPYQPMIGPVFPMLGFGPGPDPGGYSMRFGVTIRAIS